MGYVYKKCTSLLLIVFLSCFSLKASDTKDFLKNYSTLFAHVAASLAAKIVLKPDIKISKIKCPHLNKLSSEIMSKLILNPGLKDIINSMSISLVGNKEILKEYYFSTWTKSVLSLFDFYNTIIELSKYNKTLENISAKAYALMLTFGALKVGMARGTDYTIEKCFGKFENATTPQDKLKKFGVDSGKIAFNLFFLNPAFKWIYTLAIFYVLGSSEDMDHIEKGMGEIKLNSSNEDIEKAESKKISNLAIKFVENIDSIVTSF
jgi:hypothetical protein